MTTELKAAAAEIDGGQITIRDQIAMDALAHFDMKTTARCAGNGDAIKWLAEKAYELDDAMMQERNKEND